MDYKDGFLFISHVPYVNSRKQIQFGTLITSLSLAGNSTAYNGDHVINFQGEYPCHKDGSPIEQIRHSQGQNLGNGVLANFSFSNKPQGGYKDYYEKISRYIEIISAPAISIDPSVTEKTFVVIESDDDSLFNYPDTNSTRAEIHSITCKLKEQKLAIIGCGGTGSYILDLIAKTPVREIHLYDGDIMLQHNAFRAPGAPTIEKLRERLNKTEYLKEIYSSMHRYIHSHPYYIVADNLEELLSMDFIFLSLDDGKAKRLIVDYLIYHNKQFVDVGMGIFKSDEKLFGIIRTTSSSELLNDHVYTRISFAEDPMNEYAKNIQIADLNSLNAALAVIKWKKTLGFYADTEYEHNTTFTIDGNQLLNEDYAA